MQNLSGCMKAPYFSNPFIHTRSLQQLTLGKLALKSKIMELNSILHYIKVNPKGVKA